MSTLNTNTFLSNKAYKGGTKNIAEFITQVKSKIIKQASHYQHVANDSTWKPTNTSKWIDQKDDSVINWFAMLKVNRICNARTHKDSKNLFKLSIFHRKNIKRSKIFETTYWIIPVDSLRHGDPYDSFSDVSNSTDIFLRLPNHSIYTSSTDTFDVTREPITKTLLQRLSI